MLAAQGFEVQSAARGEKGRALILQDMPDPILPDVMMAGMDGYQMAAKRKGNRVTTHIPIIMLTARDDHDGKVLGLLSGAAGARNATPMARQSGSWASTKTSVASSIRKGNRPNGRRACRLPMQ